MRETKELMVVSLEKSVQGEQLDESSETCVESQIKLRSQNAQASTQIVRS
jgi:hypothetical protein